MTRFTVRLGLPLVAALSVGCTTMGRGIGWTASDAEPIRFSWERSDSVPGAMSSPLPHDSPYNGQLFQISINSPSEGTEPLLSVGFPGWSDEDHRGAAAPSRS